jgi:patatin-like phospholipase/acyl hydrolase
MRDMLVFIFQMQLSSHLKISFENPARPLICGRREYMHYASALLHNYSNKFIKTIFTYPNDFIIQNMQNNIVVSLMIGPFPPVKHE